MHTTEPLELIAESAAELDGLVEFIANAGLELLAVVVIVTPPQLADAATQSAA